MKIPPCNGNQKLFPSITDGELLHMISCCILVGELDRASDVSQLPQTSSCWKSTKSA